MRVLIQDYSSPSSTEPMYLCQSFNSVGITAALWNSDRVSAYDMFDSFQPNLFIAHFTKITSDCIKYLSQNQHVKAIINMTGAQQNHVEQLDEILRGTGLACQFIFTSTPKDINKLKSNWYMNLRGVIETYALNPTNNGAFGSVKISNGIKITAHAFYNHLISEFDSMEDPVNKKDQYVFSY